MKTQKADGQITAGYVLNGKAFVTTSTSTYRVRLRKRWRDKNKNPINLATLSQIGCLAPGAVVR